MSFEADAGGVAKMYQAVFKGEVGGESAQKRMMRRGFMAAQAQAGGRMQGEQMSGMWNE